MKTQSKVTVSAPGKLMLFGEHAVVYGHPCIVTAVGQRMHLTASKIANSKSQIAKLEIEAPDVQVTNYQKSLEHLGQGDIPKGARFIEAAVRNFLAHCHAEFDSASTTDSGQARMTNQILKKFQDDKLGIHITTRSDFASTFGFGSSSAAAVCVTKALAELFKVELTNKELFDMSYKAVLDVQGKGSGFDVAAAVYGGTLSFVAGGKVIESLAVDELSLIVAYSGIKADTITYVDQVAEKMQELPDLYGGIFAQIEAITVFAKFALIEKDWETVGELMDINQGYLEALGVSTAKLSSMIYAARDAGAYGAKLSGAGGGDCIIAITANSKKQSVQKAIEKAGGKVIEVSVNAEGVRVE